MRIRNNIACLIVVCLGTMIAMAQEGTDDNFPAVPTVASVQSSPSDSTSPADSAPVPNAGQLSDGSEVRQLGGAGFLSSNFGLTHWGPFSLGTTELFQAYASANGVSPSLLTELRTNVVAEHRFGHQNFVLQYSPKLTVVDGQLLQNFSNQDSSLSSIFNLTPRLNLAVDEHFQIFNTNYLDGGSFFSTDSLTTRSTQQAFLQGTNPSRYLTNSVNASFSYGLSGKTRLTITPTYSYSRVSGLTSPLSSNTYGATFGFDHALSATRSIGVFYSRETIRIQEHGGAFVSPYDNTGLSYNAQLTPTWGIRASIGAFREGFPSGTEWSGSANINTEKSFGKSAIVLAFYRGQGLAGVITAGTTNRADVTWRYLLSRKLQLANTAGYAAYSPVTGWYSSTNLEYAFRPNFSWFASYSYKNQTGDGFQIASIRSNFVVIGLRWHPRVLNNNY